MVTDSVVVPQSPLAVGLVGAGAWARATYGPTFGHDRDARLVAVWSRSPSNARRLARAYDAEAFHDVDEMFRRVDAVVFAVPPSVQARLAIRAATYGRPLLLEKPIADTVTHAERLAAAVSSAGVATQLALSWRYADVVADFIGTSGSLSPIAARALFVSGQVLRDSNSWRGQAGPLLDYGPHVIDLLEAVLGQVVVISPSRPTTHKQWVSLLLEHMTGATSEVALSSCIPLRRYRAEVEVFGHYGSSRIDCASCLTPQTFAKMRADFTITAQSGLPHQLDVRHGVHLQRIIDACRRAVSDGERIELVDQHRGEQGC